MHFDLTISTGTHNLTADLRLCDEHGRQIAYRQTDFTTIPVGKHLGLFDLRDHLRYYVDPKDHLAAVAETGVCIAEDVLGEEIFKLLWTPVNQRTLCLRLPGATQEQNTLAAALSRVPWEIARPSRGQQTLGERNLLVRVVHDGPEPVNQAISLRPDEPLRVLFVFAEGRGSRPLAARKERREILNLFQREIYPCRRVVAHVLAHGVTRERLQAQIEDSGGYHVVHWSGHGHRNGLELARPGGGQETITGEELLELLERAGGLIPRLFFLNACHSGDILAVKDWQGFLGAARGTAPETKSAPPVDSKDLQMPGEPGYTGTAHALLSGGVRSVVAMRYAVGDEYARDLALAFYRHLLADSQPKTVSASLSLARNKLLVSEQPEQERYLACDHATPVLYGAEAAGWILENGRSPDLDARHCSLHQIAELTLAGHEHFVGRTWELDGLGAEFIGSRSGTDVTPVAVIKGLGGMGKTALTAEALSLWERSFKWILLYQAKPNALSLDSLFRDIHMKLNEELDRYHAHVKSHPADAIHREPNGDFLGPSRFERLTRNLLRAMKDEPILLVLDNFDTNLKSSPEPRSGGAEKVWACQDPDWDRCLSLLASGLPGTPSRLLITSRRPLAALEEGAVHRVRLGPLPSGEAALYLREHEGLGKMMFGQDPAEKELAMRLLFASRFHPLLMDRLARLATAGAAFRPHLLSALEVLETGQDHSQLPDLFSIRPGDEKELAYLEDALGTSIDQSIAACSPDARRLLWMVAVANEPVASNLLRCVWSGENPRTELLHRIKRNLEVLRSLPLERQEDLRNMPPQVRAAVDSLPSRPAARPAPELLLRELMAVGLLTGQRATPEVASPEFSCHELVRERIRGWMEANPLDRADLTEDGIRRGYANWLVAAFERLEPKDKSLALDTGRRAMVYCEQVKDHELLYSFASRVVTEAPNPQFFEPILDLLKAGADSAPEGRPRWSSLFYLAAALSGCGRPDVSLGLYEQAAALARGTAEAGGEDARQAWSDIGAITHNWANALLDAGYLDAARMRHLESAKAKEEASEPAVYAVGSELEALRIDVLQGRVDEALPQVEKRLSLVQSWWKRQRAGECVPDAPDEEYLARALVSGLDITVDAHFAKDDWTRALSAIEAILEIKLELGWPSEDVAVERVNRANVLAILGRFAEAKAELEACFETFNGDPARRAEVLSSLAALFGKEPDLELAIQQERRALAIYDQLPDPRNRANSHGNLAIYMERRGTPLLLEQSADHQLVALVYQVVAGLGQDLRIARQNYAVCFLRAREAGTTLLVPRVTDILADPAFHPLAEWLQGRGVSVEEVQRQVDEALKVAQQLAEAGEKNDREGDTGMDADKHISDLLAELEAAVHDGDRDRALQLEQKILKRLASDSAQSADVERQVRALMADLDSPGATRSWLDHRDHEMRRRGPVWQKLSAGMLSLERSTEPTEAGVVYPVWFGTNRKPTPGGESFTGERNGEITRGRVDVCIPESHRFGETGNSFWKRLLRFDLRDDRLRIQAVSVRQRDAFFGEIHASMQDARDAGEVPHALIYLHGFNVSFEEAAIRAAQIGYDLKVTGATAFFSWPSRGSVSAYLADEATIEASEKAITEFLEDFTQNCGAEKVHVIAHSMGNRGLLRALQRIAAADESRSSWKLCQVFLAAPDIDRDLFLDLAHLYPAFAERTTLYASPADLPVHLSAKLHDAPRAGYFTPYTVAPGIDTVEVPDFDIDLLGHAYFAQADALLHDIFDLIRDGRPPGKRQRIEPATDNGLSFWRVRR